MPNKLYNKILDEHLHILITQGCYEAFLEIKKRYHKHAQIVCTKLLNQYQKTGITKVELVSVCDDNLPIVLRKYVSGLSSFYNFWERCTTQVAMDYLVDFSYGAEGVYFSGTFSIDQDLDGRLMSPELLKEKDESKAIKRQIFEIKSIIAKFEIFFTKVEVAILNLVLEGYSIADLEKTGLYCKSQLYLTYHSAIDKVKHYLDLSYKK